MKETKLNSSMSTKIQGYHLDRLAIVYIRQSTLQQVEKNKESTKLQYGLVNRAEMFGWSPHRILVIDEDLGRSGATAEGRPGFQRLVAEVGLNNVGIIFGIEMSRLARSNRDWHHLLEVCGIFDTLIADTDGVYDPTAYNDRLLLGLKGTMSEAELHIIKQRMLEGKLAKARRGELGMRVPSGYILHPSGEIRKDPDEQAQAVIRSTKLGMPEISLYCWLKKGKLSAKLNETVRPNQWVIFADELEIARLQELRTQPRKWSKHIRIDNT